MWSFESSSSLTLAFLYSQMFSNDFADYFFVHLQASLLAAVAVVALEAFA